MRRCVRDPRATPSRTYAPKHPSTYAPKHLRTQAPKHLRTQAPTPRPPRPPPKKTGGWTVSIRPVSNALRLGALGRLAQDECDQNDIRNVNRSVRMACAEVAAPKPALFGFTRVGSTVPSANVCELRMVRSVGLTY